MQPKKSTGQLGKNKIDFFFVVISIEKKNNLKFNSLTTQSEELDAIPDEFIWNHRNKETKVLAQNRITIKLVILSKLFSYFQFDGKK